MVYCVLRYVSRYRHPRNQTKLLDKDPNDCFLTELMNFLKWRGETRSFNGTNQNEKEYVDS